jgi:homoserine kinase
MLRTFEELGCRPSGIELTCINEIPQARGMGSSSAAIVAGLLLARQLVEGGPGKLGKAGLIRLAAEIEGHPDNVAPCLLGGFTIAWTDDTGPPDGGAHAISLGDASGVALVIFVPVQRGYTAQARAVLPASVPLRHAAFNVARSALFVRAITGSPGLLLAATEDRIHQDSRAAAMPDTAKLVAALRSDGIAAVVSGSGPSVLALVPDDQRLIREAQSRCPDGWWARHMAVATEGARVQ